MTTSSGPGFSLKQEGISYLCSGDIPAVIADVMRIGSGLGDIFQGQGDYWQLTVAVGMEITIPLSLLHRAYKKMLTLLISPLILLKNTAILFSWHQMQAIGQMVEPVELPAMKEHDTISMIGSSDLAEREKTADCLESLLGYRSRRICRLSVQ